MKRMQIVLVAALFVGAAAAAGAQESLTLSLTKAAPKVDGVVSDKEYSVTTTASGIQVSLSWTADALYVAVAAPTTGWVATGLGSDAMDGALIYIGYVSGDTVQLKVQQGTGHRHADTEGKAPVQYAMKEAGGRTVLEIALKASDFIATGQKQLALLAAMGGSDSFTALHRARVPLAVTLAQ